MNMFKNLFLVSDEQEKENVNVEVNVSPKVEKGSFSFPTKEIENPTFPMREDTKTFSDFSTPKTNEVNPELESTMRVYENGFDGLNKDGADFFEFYKSIIEDGNLDNTQLYPTIFKIFSSMNPKFTVDSVVKDGEYYIGELEKQFQSFKSNGEAKYSETLLKKQDEGITLKSDVDSVKKQIISLKNELEAKENQLALLDNKYDDILNTINNKLEANVISKDTIVNSIRTAIKNIKLTIK